MLAPWKKSYDQPRQHIKKQRHYFVNKGPSSQSYGFSSSHVWMWESYYEESWVLKNWYFWTVVLKKTLESPLDYKIMASGPITSWQIDAENSGNWLTLFFWAPKLLQMVIAAMKLKDACFEFERCYDQPRQHIKKQRHYFANKGPSSQSYGFSVVMYGCESWTKKKAQHWRIDAFELWCWRRLLRDLWNARRLNQSILREINPDYSLEGLVLKLKLQYFGHLMQRADSLGKTLMLGKIEGRRRRGWQRMRWLNGITDSVGMSLSKCQEIVKERGAWSTVVHGVTKSKTQLSHWKTTTTTTQWGENSCQQHSKNQRLYKLYIY